jgi:hypothetical protein
MSHHLDSIANGTMFFCAVTTAVVGLFLPDITLSPAAAAVVPLRMPIDPPAGKGGGQSVLSDVRLVRECGSATCD